MLDNLDAKKYLEGTFQLMRFFMVIRYLYLEKIKKLTHFMLQYTKYKLIFEGDESVAYTNQ